MSTPHIDNWWFRYLDLNGRGFSFAAKSVERCL